MTCLSSQRSVICEPDRFEGVRVRLTELTLGFKPFVYCDAARSKTPTTTNHGVINYFVDSLDKHTSHGGEKHARHDGLDCVCLEVKSLREKRQEILNQVWNHDILRNQYTSILDNFHGEISLLAFLFHTSSFHGFHPLLTFRSPVITSCSGFPLFFVRHQGLNCDGGRHRGFHDGGEGVHVEDFQRDGGVGKTPMSVTMQDAVLCGKTHEVQICPLGLFEGEINLGINPRSVLVLI